MGTYLCCIPWRNNADSEHEVCNCGLACDFWEHGKKRTCLRCHRTKWLSAIERLWDVLWDHQYSAGSLRGTQNLTGPWASWGHWTRFEQVLGWTTCTGPCQSTWFYNQTLVVFTSQFHLRWPPEFIFDWIAAYGRTQRAIRMLLPRVDENISCLRRWHERNRRQFDGEEKKIKTLLLFLVACFIFYS